MVQVLAVLAALGRVPRACRCATVDGSSESFDTNVFSPLPESFLSVAG